MRIKVISLIEIFEKLDEFEKQKSSKEHNFSFLECQKLIPGIKNVPITIDKFINMIIVFCSLSKKDFEKLYKKPFLYHIHRYNLEREEYLNLDLIRVESDSFDQGSEIKLQSDNEDPQFHFKKFSFSSENFSYDSEKQSQEQQTDKIQKLRKGDNQKTKKYLQDVKKNKFLIKESQQSKEKFYNRNKLKQAQKLEKKLKKILNKNSQKQKSPPKEQERSNSQKQKVGRRERFLTQNSNFSSDKQKSNFATQKEDFFFLKNRNDMPLNNNMMFQNNAPIKFKKQFSQKDKMKSFKRKNKNKSTAKDKSKKKNPKNNKSLFKTKEKDSKSRSNYQKFFSNRNNKSTMVSNSCTYQQFFPLKMNSKRRDIKKKNSKNVETKDQKNSFKNQSPKNCIKIDSLKLKKNKDQSYNQTLNWFEPIIKYNFITFLDNLLQEVPELKDDNILLTLEQEVQKCQDKKIISFDIDNKNNEFLETFLINDFQLFQDFFFEFCSKYNISITKVQIGDITRLSVCKQLNPFIIHSFKNIIKKLQFLYNFMQNFVEIIINILIYLIQIS